MMSGKMNTNQYCTREVAACNYQPKFIKKNRQEASIACNEAVSSQEKISQDIANTLVGRGQVVADHSDHQRAHNSRLVLHPGTLAKSKQGDATEGAITGSELKRRTFRIFITHLMTWLRITYDTFFTHPYKFEASYHFWSSAYGNRALEDLDNEHHECIYVQQSIVTTVNAACRWYL
jgi:hypothetical protein